MNAAQGSRAGSRAAATVAGVVLGAVLAQGCAVATFKRGAGPGAMAADEATCAREAADIAGRAACMRRLGWMVEAPGVPDAADVAVGAPGPVAHAAGAAAPEAGPPPLRPAAGAATGAPVAAPAAAPTVAAAASATPGDDPGGSAPVRTLVDGAAPALPRSLAPAAPGAAAAAAAPTDTLQVGSWWKFGAGASALDGAVARCVDQLGAAHRPDAGVRTVTVALRDCLRADGWRGRSG